MIPQIDAYFIKIHLEKFIRVLQQIYVNLNLKQPS